MRTPERQSKISRRVMYGVTTVIIGLLGYIGSNIIPFTVAGYKYWAQQEKHDKKMETMFMDFIKKDSVQYASFAAQLDLHSSAISFQSGELKSIQRQTSDNTDAIYTILKSDYDKRRSLGARFK